MPYLTYNLPIQRTGFRPYGTTNTWSATQLSGLGRPRQIFSEPGGRRLGSYNWQKGFSPAILRGMGQDDGSGDVLTPGPGAGSGDLTAPVVTSYTPQPLPTGIVPTGDTSGGLPAGLVSSTPTASQMPTWGGGGCMSGGLVVPCPGTSSSGGVATLSPGPSPRVTAPTTMFAATAPPTATAQTIAASPCPAGYTYTTSGCVASSTNWSQYLPIFALVGIAVLMMSQKK